MPLIAFLIVNTGLIRAADRGAKHNARPSLLDARPSSAYAGFAPRASPVCGRYYRRSDKQRIAEAFRVGVPPSFDILPSYNIAPQTFQPVVRLDAETQQRELALLRWGLIPFWARDPKIGYSTINAKAETLAVSPAFREALKRRRCLVPADGFYEWQALDKKTKQPWAIALRDGSPLAFAGLWETWKDKTTGQPLETYTIVTTEPNELTAKLHNRMPVILAPRDYDRWLAPADAARLPTDLLRPYDADQMISWKVSSAVGNVRNNSADLCQEVIAESASPISPL